eukprot:349801-Chlamydomonas_euryale.AAC.36
MNASAAQAPRRLSIKHQLCFKRAVVPIIVTGYGLQPADCACPGCGVLYGSNLDEIFENRIQGNLRQQDLAQGVGERSTIGTDDN